MKLFRLGLLLVICFCKIFHAQCQKNKFDLKGQVLGNNIKLIVLNYHNDRSKLIKDTAVVLDGRFRFTGTLTHPVHAELIGSKGEKEIDYYNFTTLFIEPERMNVTVAEGKFIDFKLEGSKTQFIWDKLRVKQRPIVDNLDSLYKEFSLFKDSTNANNLTSSKNYIRNDDRYNFVKDSLLQELSRMEYVFLQEYPSSYIAPFFLQNHFSDTPIEKIKNIYASWPKEIQQSLYGKNIAQEIKKKEMSSLLQEAPDFSATTIDGETVKLSSFRGKKNVLLEFWASWCVPCRQSFPDLKNLLTEPHMKDLIIIAIALDNKEDSWKKAITKDSISNWYNILAPIESNNKFQRNRKILNKYEVLPIPMQYLVDKTGKIVGHWIGQSKENENSLREKVKEISK